MNTITRLDKIIVKLVHVRNTMSKYDLIDFDINLHPLETEATAIHDAINSQAEELNNEPPRN